MINKLKKILEPIIGYGIVFIVLIAVISVIAILGGGIMRLFGFEYTSVKSIIIFFTIVHTSILFYYFQVYNRLLLLLY